MSNEETHGEERPSTGGFEEQLDEIDAIVERLESDEVELEEALSLFERGVARLRQAGRLLESAEGRVEELIASTSGDDSEDGAEGAGLLEVEDIEG
jgi:exodeoxyribonuclease VII small subunit